MRLLRRYFLWFFIAVCLAAIAIGLGYKPPEQAAPELRPLRSRIGEAFTDPEIPCNWVVVIDPGHGGSQYVGRSSPNNAAGEELLEKDLTLEVGLIVRDLLDRSGYNIVMTRTTDVNLSLRERTKLARDNQADAFVSIHFNGFDDETIQGTETIRHADASERSIEFARTIQTYVLGATGLSDRGVRTTKDIDLDIVVLRPGEHVEKTVAALVEISFLTDPEEEERLKTRGYKRALGRAIQHAIGEYLTRQQAALNCIP